MELLAEDEKFVQGWLCIFFILFFSLFEYLDILFECNLLQIRYPVLLCKTTNKNLQMNVIETFLKTLWLKYFCRVFTVTIQKAD